MTARTNWFRSCVECNSTAPNHSGVCDECAIRHGYANDNRAPVAFSDDVQPDQREAKEDLCST